MGSVRSSIRRSAPLSSPFSAASIHGASSRRSKLAIVAATVVALVALGFRLDWAAAGASAAVVAMLVWRHLRQLRARRLTAVLQEQLAVSAPRNVHFDAVVALLARHVDLRWAGLLEWRESEMTGNVVLERSIAAGPTEVALTSWLIREAEAGSSFLVAGGHELGCEGFHVALPLRGPESLNGFLAFAFARALPREVELALRAVLPEFARTLGVSGVPRLTDAHNLAAAL